MDSNEENMHVDVDTSRVKRVPLNFKKQCYRDLVNPFTPRPSNGKMICHSNFLIR